MDNFNLLVITPHKRVFEGEASRLSCKNDIGEFSIFVNHENFLTAVVPGKITIVDSSNKEHEYFASGGMLEVREGAVTLCVDTVETRGEIDVIRAQLSMKKAEDLEENNADTKVDEMRKKLALGRAIARIEFAQDK